MRKLAVIIIVCRPGFYKSGSDAAVHKRNHYGKIPVTRQSRSFKNPTIDGDDSEREGEINRRENALQEKEE